MWALLPLKDFVQAKQRLSGTLSAAERRSLFHAMVEDVLAVVCADRQFERVVLVSDDPAAGLLAEHYGATCWPEVDFGVQGLNAVVSAAVQRSVTLGAQTVMVIHGDLPLISEGELDTLRQQHRSMPGDRKVTLATDRHGQGSNVLLCTPPAVIEFSYGPDSSDLHRRNAQSCGAAFQQLCLPGLSRDIDNRDDLVELLSGDWPQRARRTLKYLDDSGIASRLIQMLGDGANSDALPESDETDTHASK